MKKLSFIISCLVFGLVLSTTYIPCAKAANINVPGDYYAIQEAIDAAGDGDVVIVGLGTYVENINFLGKAITVKSADPYDPDIVANTIIDGNQLDAVVVFENGEGSGSMVNGLTIQNSVIRGIYCCDSHPTISNCVMSKNYIGIECFNSTPTITNCIINENLILGIQLNFNSRGGYDFTPGLATINNCIITGNGGRGIWVEGEPDVVLGRQVMISDCSINENAEGGIYCSGSDALTIHNCIITENSASSRGGGGIFCDLNSSPTITNCIIARNSAKLGGGIYCRGYIIIPSPDMYINDLSRLGIVFNSLKCTKISNCTITENSASNSGGGIFTELSVWVFWPMPMDIPILHGGMGRSLSAPVVTNCILWENSPDEIAGKRLKITHSNVQGGYFGIGNINTGPLFVDPEAGDYHLQQGSPCIKRGRRRCDMGAYGFQTQWPWSVRNKQMRRY